MFHNGFHAMPFARVDIAAHFDLRVEDWLRWSMLQCTLYPAYDEGHLDNDHARTDFRERQSVEDIKRWLLDILADAGSVAFEAAHLMDPLAFRAMAELVHEKLAYDDSDAHGLLVMVIKLQGLDALGRRAR